MDGCREKIQECLIVEIVENGHNENVEIYEDSSNNRLSSLHQALGSGCVAPPPQ